MGMKQARQWTLSFILILTLVCGCGMTALADEVIDPDETGSISVTLKSESGELLSGGELSLYRIAEIIDNSGNGSYEYRFLQAYDQCDESLLENIFSSRLPEQLEAYVLGNGISPDQTVTIGSDGTAVFSDLKTGLYMIRQTMDSAGYKTVSPFVISVPLQENGSLIYNVDASPKVEKAEAIEGSPDGGNPYTGKETEKGSEVETGKVIEEGSTEETLPQTGALIWPIIILAIIGVVLIGGGIVLIAKKKPRKYSHAE